jgi:hypothetical protein
VNEVRRPEVAALYADLFIEFLFEGGLSGVARFERQSRETTDNPAGYGTDDGTDWAAHGTKPSAR